MADDCIFCKIATGVIPAAFVAETPDAVAFRDIDPKAPTHILIVPKKHVESLATTDDVQLLGHLMAVAAKVACDVGIADSGYRTVINTRRDGGQTVDHLHVHLMGGRRMTWPPG